MAASTSKTMIRNTGSRRVILGAPAKSKGGGAMVRFDTAADAGVKADKRLGQVHELEGDRAKSVVGSRVFQAMKDRLGLQVA